MKTLVKSTESAAKAKAITTQTHKCVYSGNHIHTEVVEFVTKVPDLAAFSQWCVTRQDKVPTQRQPN